MLYPPAIIFVNDDLVEQIKNVLKSQLFLDEILSGDQFDGYVLAENYITVDGEITQSDYVDKLKIDKKRILVVRTFNNLQNKNLADIVIFIKAGLASIQKNNFGPPMQTYPVASLTMFQLLGSSSVKDVIL